ncbi:MAG: hypothetical protein ACRDPE_15795 [Solirubrobacterales bacterium]
MTRPYKVQWDFGRVDGQNPRTLSFASEEAAVKVYEGLDPEKSKPWAEVRGPEGRIKPNDEDAAGTIHTVHLIVKAEQSRGPDMEWDEVAEMVARQINSGMPISLSNGAAFDLTATVDTAE